MDSVLRTIELATRKCVTAWVEAPGDPPTGLFQFTRSQQRENEKEIDFLLKQAFQQWAQRESFSGRERLVLAKRARYAVTSFLLRTDDASVSQFMEECEKVAELFLRKAKDFDSTVSDLDILQGLRNQWVFNSIQKYLGQPVSVTPASFAYSMLYPYTDNRLDVAGHAESETESFLAWLSLRLHGVEENSNDTLTQKVGELLGMIEHQYPRSAFPELHSSLLAIHAAQERGLCLRGKLPVERENHFLAASVEKGGTSVLADGFLVTGSLTVEMVEVMFVYGVILQFIDDLQDIDEDIAAGHSSAFTRAIERGRLDVLTNRLFSYLQWCLTAMRSHAPEGVQPLCSMIGRSCLLLILEAVACHKKFYDQEFLNRMEPCMPLRIDALGNVKQRLKQQMEQYHANRTPVRLLDQSQQRSSRKCESKRLPLP